MFPTIIVRHRRGSKLNQIECFELGELSEITIGRDPKTMIAFDPAQDAVVSRRHAVIKIGRGQPLIFTIIDTGSSNGTFVNGTRIIGETVLLAGYSVELGKGGPEFIFDLDPELATRHEKAFPLNRAATVMVRENSENRAAPAGVRSPSTNADRGMRIAALIFSVAGSLSALSLAVYTYAIATFFVAVGGGNYGGFWQLLSVVIPVSCIIGTGILWTAPGLGGVILLVCAVVILMIAGFNFFSMATIILLAAGGGFAIVSIGIDAAPLDRDGTGAR